MSVCNQQLPHRTVSGMPRLPIFRLGSAPKPMERPELAESTPAIALEGLSLGVDNLRHDVLLSAKLVEAVRAHIGRMVARHGELEGLLAVEAGQAARGSSWIKEKMGRGPRAKSDPAEWKSLLTELLVASLNRAKKESK